MGTKFETNAGQCSYKLEHFIWVLGLLIVETEKGSILCTSINFGGKASALHPRLVNFQSIRHFPAPSNIIFYFS